MEKTLNKIKRETSSKDFYVCFKESKTRTWSDSVKYGFISGGVNPWDSRTLFLLKPGNRIFVNISNIGYVGVGLILESPIKASEFEIPDANGNKQKLSKIQNKPPVESTLLIHVIMDRYN